MPRPPRGNTLSETAMKNRIATAVIILFLLLAALVALSACDVTDGVFLPAADAEGIAEQVVRIHIRANSNSEEDQAVKLAVRDDITAYLTSKLEGCENKTDALRVLDGEKENLRYIAQKALERNGYDYKVRVELKPESFPERTYDDYTFPAGEYDALMIYLGEGTGDNWWCVAFPPLCFLPGDGENITYASWVKELLDRIF